MEDLVGKTAFVTGAASGIGLGIASALAQAGAKVMLCDIQESALKVAVDSLRQGNVDVDGVIADVSLKAELQAAAMRPLRVTARFTSWSTTPAWLVGVGLTTIGIGFSASI